MTKLMKTVLMLLRPAQLPPIASLTQAEAPRSNRVTMSVFYREREMKPPQTNREQAAKSRCGSSSSQPMSLVKTQHAPSCSEDILKHDCGGEIHREVVWDIKYIKFKNTIK